MNKKLKKARLSFVKNIFLILNCSFSLLFVLNFFSCQSTNQQIESASTTVTSTYETENQSNKNSQSENKKSAKLDSVEKSNMESSTASVAENNAPAVAVQQTATQIKIEKKSHSKENDYFSSINKEIVLAIQNGSPSSIRNAVSKLKKADIEYSENEIVLLNIADSIMKIVWKSEPPLENIPSSKNDKKYSAIIDSAKAGYFEKREAKNDFFQLVLPCLSLTSSTLKPDFFSDIEINLQNAISFLQEKNRNSVLCNYLLGLLYKKQGDNEKALFYFDRATEKNVIVYELYFEKASCLVQLKKYEQVSNILEPLLIQFPSDTKILKLYANVCLLLRDYQKAERYASLILQQNPSDLEFVLFRAKIFVETGEYLKASSLLDVYARSYPTNREYLLLRSIIQKEWNRNLTLSVSTIEQALELYPNDFEVILYAARLSVETNQKIAGKSSVELASIILKIAPDNVEALKVLALSYFNQNQFAKAYEISKKNMTDISQTQNLSQPQNSKDLQDDYFMHIKTCLALNYNEEAFKYASVLYEKFQSENQVIQLYIDVLIKTLRLSSATKLINSLLNNSPSSIQKSFLFYERSFLQPNETAILSDLRSSLIANPRNSDSLFRMYEIYFARKDYKKAQYYLKQVVSLNPNNEKFIKLNSALDELIQ